MLPRCTGLPKINKERCPMRPIVSAIGSPLYSLVKELSRILTPLLTGHTQHMYTAKNSSLCWESPRDPDHTWGQTGQLWCDQPLHSSPNWWSPEDLLSNFGPFSPSVFSAEKAFEVETSWVYNLPVKYFAHLIDFCSNTVIVGRAGETARLNWRSSTAQRTKLQCHFHVFHCRFYMD